LEIRKKYYNKNCEEKKKESWRKKDKRSQIEVLL
jgi:hypothetical protein